MSQFDNIVFGKKKFSDLLEEIYNNQQKKDKQVTSLINELKPLISDIGDATLVVPLIKEYMDISVKNDDILIKMAALAQRAMQTQMSDGTLKITDEEKNMIKGVDPKAKQITSDKSEEVKEAGNNYHANRTGFARPSGQRDDERHDLDTPRPTIYGLKINGKIWEKDGNVVTFFTRERALAARNSILAKRPDVEVGLVQRPQN